MVKLSKASSKVTEICLDIGTSVVRSAGFMIITKGAVISGAAPVVNDQTLALARALSAKSVPPVEIVAVNSVFAARVLIGLNVAVVPT